MRGSDRKSEKKLLLLMTRLIKDIKVKRDCCMHIDSIAWGVNCMATCPEVMELQLVSLSLTG